ncbi:DUF2461 family protein, partial [Myxococcota bacterium]|nr:DUF2461 family protein [Myxococcota bacterium]
MPSSTRAAGIVNPLWIPHLWGLRRAINVGRIGGPANTFLVSRCVMSQFNGFYKETVSFFKELTQHNNKEWFDEHRHEYDTFVVEPS